MPILHRTVTLTALMPRYASRFSCIGQACEDTCCKSWQVTLDKKTFKAYRQATDSAIAPRLAAAVKRPATQTGKLDYGVIELIPETRACPLLDEQMCAVQQHLGASHLSHTCFSYPRATRDFGGQPEQALMLSCPEAARQALLAPDAFDFVEAPIEVRPDVVGRVASRHGIALEVMNEVRIFCLTLLRTTDLPLWQRLALLGLFCERLSATLAQGRHDAVGTLLNNFITLVEQGQAGAALAGMQPDYTAQALVFSTLWGGRSFVTDSPVRNRVIDAVAKGLGADDSGQVAAEQLVERYRTGVQRLPAALQAAPHLLDHYLLNEVFGNLFPFDGKDPYQNYLQLVARFGLLRLMLAAQCSGDTLPDAAALVQTVHVLCRRFQHDPVLAAKVNEILVGSAWGELAKVYRFLRT
jgi:lysine-N-methylase